MSNFKDMTDFDVLIADALISYTAGFLAKMAYNVLFKKLPT